MGIHVHVYRINGMQEFDIDTIDEVYARSEAVKLSKESDKWKDADCKLLAVTFNEGKKD